jgi:hypothetical protein
VCTLIAVYNSEGCIGRCDAKCYAASDPDCDCICGGMNHGKGKQRALDKTRELAESWIERYKSKHPGLDLHFEVPTQQSELFA